MKKQVYTATPITTNLAPTFSLPMPAPEMDLAGRVNYWHRMACESAQNAIKAAVIAGLTLAFAQGQNNGMFDRWVEANCQFSRRTAYRYLTLANRIFTLDKLPKLLAGSDEDRINAVDEFASETDSKTLTELYCDLGIIKKTPSKLGGRREGAGRKKKLSAEQLAADAEAIVAATRGEQINDLMVKLYQVGVIEDGFGAMARDALFQNREMLEAMISRINEVLKGRSE